MNLQNAASSVLEAAKAFNLSGGLSSRQGDACTGGIQLSQSRRAPLVGKIAPSEVANCQLLCCPDVAKVATNETNPHTFAVGLFRDLRVS